MATAKKPAAAKRAYNRKPAAPAVEVKKPARRRRPVKQEPQQKDPSLGNVEMAKEVPTETAPSGMDMFLKTDAIDLRDTPIPSRFGVFFQLESLGYLFDHSLDRKPTDLLHLMQNAEVLVLNHTNKLVRATDAESLKGCSGVSKVDAAHLEVTLAMSIPKPMSPDVIAINGEIFIKATGKDIQTMRGVEGVSLASGDCDHY